MITKEDKKTAVFTFCKLLQISPSKFMNWVATTRNAYTNVKKCNDWNYSNEFTSWMDDQINTIIVMSLYDNFMAIDQEGSLDDFMRQKLWNTANQRILKIIEFYPSLLQQDLINKEVLSAITSQQKNFNNLITDIQL